jgi:hypothetical protein
MIALMALIALPKNRVFRPGETRHSCFSSRSTEILIDRSYRLPFLAF